MQFTITKTDFLKAMAMPVSAADKKTTIPILSNVLIEASDGRVRVTGTDLELGIISSASANVKQAGSVTLPAKRLYSFIGALPECEINIKATENHWATVNAGRSKSKIPGMSAESFPEIPKRPEVAAMRLSLASLKNLIHCTEFAIS